MAFRAVAARSLGDDYQARWFWIQACRLFDDRPCVERVGYELALARAFDDVVTFHCRPAVDEFGDPIDVDCFQAKFHVDQRRQFTCGALTDPEFVSGTSVSLLQRLRQARDVFERAGRRGRFSIISPWIIHPDDPLVELVSSQGGEIRLHKLREGGERSEMGRVRAAWRSHLRLGSDGELEEVLRPLRIRAGQGDLGMLRDLLNAKLRAAGFAPVDDARMVHPYDDLARKLVQRDRREFDRDTLRQLAENEDLWLGDRAPEPGPTRLGIRSFMRFAEYLEDETDDLLSLVHHFDNRYIREPGLWHGAVYPDVERFLRAAVRPGDTYQLYLECHGAIAFAAGYSLDPKAGAAFSIVQKAHGGRHVWHPDPNSQESGDPLWSWSEIGSSPAGPDLAMAISLTRPIGPDVGLYVRENLPSVGRILGCSVLPKVGPSAVRDGTHALHLARDLAARLQEERTPDERRGTLHIFASAPNGFTFLLGREARSFGRCSIYEHDFDTNLPGAYRLGLSFPPAGGA